MNSPFSTGLDDLLFDGDLNDVALEDLLQIDVDIPDIDEPSELEKFIIHNIPPSFKDYPSRPEIPAAASSSASTGGVSMGQYTPASYYSTLQEVLRISQKNQSSGTYRPPVTPGPPVLQYALSSSPKATIDDDDDDGGEEEEEDGSKPGGPRRVVRDKARRQKHNATERRRLQKINERITDLKNLMTAQGVKTKDNKTDILQAAVEHMHMLNTTLMAVNLEKADKEAEISALRTLISTLANSGSSSQAAVSGIPSFRGSTVSTGSVNYRKAFAFGMVPTIVCGLNGTIVDVNLMFLLLTGYTREELVNRNMAALFVTIDNGASSTSVFSHIVTKNLEDTKVKVIEMHQELVMNGGKPCHCVLRTSLLYDEGHVPHQLQLICLPLVTRAPLGTIRPLSSDREGLDRTSLNEFIVNVSDWYIKPDR